MFAFDLDGVLVDTIGTLYSAYLSILESFGTSGSEAEFDFLNGKNVNEIAEHLKQAHQLDCDESELIDLFQSHFDTLYANVDLIPGALWILEFLQSQDARLALASGSSRKNIDVILGRFELEPFFEMIVSGDDVEKAKPSPDIYNLVKRHFQTNRCYVVEDSSNGIQAARCAGLITVLFDPNNQNSGSTASLVIQELFDIEQIVRERQTRPILLSNCTKVEIKTVSDQFRLTDEMQLAADEIWQAESSKNPSLFNGRILSYASHIVTPEDTIVVECFETQYKYFLAQLRLGIDYGVQPLAVSGVVIDKNRSILIGQRSMDVTEYPGLHEFVPSGGITATPGSENGYQRQVEIELEEETGIPAHEIELISPFELIHDPRHGVYDIAVFVELRTELDVTTLKSNEYSNFSLLDVNSLTCFEPEDFAPTSRAICALLIEALGQ